jgi:hypothetical protein
MGRPMGVRTRPLPWGIVGRVALVSYALSRAFWVANDLAYFVTGVGDPGKQFFLPHPWFDVQLALAYYLPFATALSLGWWPRRAARLAGWLSWWALLGSAWIVLVTLNDLDARWPTVGFPPPGEIWLVNATGHTVSYTTTPALWDVVARWTDGAPLAPGQMRALRGIPWAAPVAIAVADEGGRPLFCRTVAAEGRQGYGGRVVIEVAPASCPPMGG